MPAAQNLRVKPQYPRCGMSRLSCEIYQARGKQSFEMFCPAVVLHHLPAVPSPKNPDSLIMCQNIRQQVESYTRRTPRNTINHIV